MQVTTGPLAWACWSMWPLLLAVRICCEILTLPSRGGERHLIKQQWLQCAAEQAAQLPVMQQPPSPVHVAFRNVNWHPDVKMATFWLTTELQRLDNAVSNALDTVCTLTSKRPLLDPNLLRLPRPALLLAFWGSPGTVEVWRLAIKLPRLSSESCRCS